MINLLSLFLSSVLWVQVPQWSDDWSKCAVDIPDIPSIDKQTAIEKLQSR